MREIRAGSMFSEVVADFVAEASITGNLVRASVSVPAIDLMPVNFMRDPFKNFDLTISAQHFVEF